MKNAIHRRDFLLAVGATLATLALPKPSHGEGERVSPLIDHIILGCKDLNAGVEFVSARTGVHPIFGGVHPGAGTRNAVLYLGERQYLEVLAPDPGQRSSADPYNLRALPAPCLIGWAVHTNNIEQTAERIRAGGIEVLDAQAGSRRRPDGQLLSWRIVPLKDDMHGLLPFFVEWGVTSPHPSIDAPRGCRLKTFEICAPDRVRVRHRLEMLGLDIPVIAASLPHLRATISGPRGKLELNGCHS
jgi:Glyoxalase-like domain